MLGGYVHRLTGFLSAFTSWAVAIATHKVVRLIREN